MQAYKNDAAFRTAFIAEMKWHQDQDKLKHGTYGEGSNGDFRGCAVGCGIHSLARLQNRKLDTSDHSILAKELNIPVELFYLQDALFESLPQERSLRWPLEFSEAIAEGADCSQVHIHFMYWLLTDKEEGVIRFAGTFVEVKAAIERVGELLLKDLSGVHIAEEWEAARSAARSAAWSAAWSARSARSAAWSARSARSARSAARIRQADKLLQLLKDAPRGR